MFSEKLLSRRADERLFHASTLLVGRMQNVAVRLMFVFLAGRRIDGIDSNRGRSMEIFSPVGNIVPVD